MLDHRDDTVAKTVAVVRRDGAGHQGEYSQVRLPLGRPDQSLEQDRVSLPVADARCANPVLGVGEANPWQSFSMADSGITRSGFVLSRIWSRATRAKK